MVHVSQPQLKSSLEISPILWNCIFNGFDVTKDIRHALFDVGSLVETPSFVSYQKITPEDILSYFGKLRGMDDEYIQSRMNIVLELVKLTKWKKEKLGTFSKGMRQRV